MYWIKQNDYKVLHVFFISITEPVSEISYAYKKLNKKKTV